MILIKGNIERIAVTEVQAEKLKAEGFEELVVHAAPVDSAGKTDIISMTVKQLRLLAKEKGLDGSDSLNREELLEVLKDVM